MIVRIDVCLFDTCGNVEHDFDDPRNEYLDADSWRDVWVYLSRPRVSWYRKGSNTVRSIRTPAGYGYGNWEPNPEFDSETALDSTDVEAFEFIMFFTSLRATKVTFRRLVPQE